MYTSSAAVVGLTQARARVWGPCSLRGSGPREQSLECLRWCFTSAPQVHHDRGGFKYSLVGHVTRARARDRLAMTGFDRLTSRIPVSPREWEGSGSPSVGAWFTAITPRTDQAHATVRGFTMPASPESDSGRGQPTDGASP